jgi:hypothetical protein
LEPPLLIRVTKQDYKPDYLTEMKLKHTIVAFLTAPLFLNAQEDALINRGETIYVQQGALIEVQGNLINDSTAEGSGIINNDGTIELTGNFENREGAKFRTYNNDASKERVVKFIGSGKQTIAGDISRTNEASFYNLVIDKANSADTVEMQAGLVIEGSLVFGSASATSTYAPVELYHNNNQKGLLKTYSESGDFVVDVQNGNPDAIAGYPVLQIDGAPATGFIMGQGLRGSNDGGLIRKISSATSYVFPIGTEGKGFNGARLNFAQVPGGGSVKTKFCDGSSNPEGYVGSLSAFCAGCDEDNPADNTGYNRYFASNDCNGGQPQWIVFDHSVINHGYWSFESTNNGYKYDMEVFPNNFPDDYANRNSSWRVIKHEGPYSEDPSGAETDWTPEIESLVSDPNDLLTFTRNMGCYEGDGVPGGTYADFSHFTMGMTHSGAALPVKLIYVKADYIGKHRNRVTWGTALEINNAGFEVHRSTDGVNFTNVGWVPGHDNSTVTQTYSFEDRPTESSNIFYYQLRQVDNDGQFEWSPVVQVTIAAEASTFAMYPNPTSKDVFIDVMSPADEIFVKMYDLKGAVVFDNIFPVTQNGSSQTVAIEASSILPPGTYVITATTNGAKFSNKVVLQ